MTLEDTSDDGKSPIVTRRSALSVTAGGLLATSLSARTVVAQETDRLRWNENSLPGFLKVVAGTVVINEENGTIRGLNPDNGNQKWSLDGGGDRPPTVADGKLFFSFNNYERPSGIRAVSALSGEKLWESVFGTGGYHPRHPPTVADGMVFAQGMQTDFIALNADTGDEKWTVDLSFHSLVKPTVKDGNVFVVGQEYDISSGVYGRNRDTGDFYIYALDAETGAQQWKYKIQSDGEDDPEYPPKVVDGKVIISTRNDLYAFDAETGEKQWVKHNWDNTLYFERLTVADGTLFVNRGGGDIIEQRSVETGEISWKWKITDNHWATRPTVSNGTVFIAVEKGFLLAVDVDTGEKEWTFELPGPKAIRNIGRITKPVVVDGTVFIGGSDIINDSLYAIEADTGKEEWRFNNGANPIGIEHMAVARDTVFAVEPGGGLYAIEITPTDDSSPANEDAAESSLLQRFIDLITGVGSEDLSSER